MTLVIRLVPDSSLWLAVPREWPYEQWSTPEKWASDVAAGIVTREVGEPEPTDVVKSWLISFANSRKEFPADLTYLFWGDGVLPFEALDCALLPAEGAPERRFRFLGRVDAPGAVGEVRVEQVDLPGLGRGTRVVRFDAVDPDSEGVTDLLASARYFWRLNEDVDLAVNVSTVGPMQLLRLLPAVEDALSTVGVSA